jgi:hypothetical protein
MKNRFFEFGFATFIFMGSPAFCQTVSQKEEIQKKSAAQSQARAYIAGDLALLLGGVAGVATLSNSNAASDPTEIQRARADFLKNARASLKESDVRSFLLERGFTSGDSPYYLELKKLETKLAQVAENIKKSPLGRTLDDLTISKTLPEETSDLFRRQLGRSLTSAPTTHALVELKNLKRDIDSFNSQWGKIKGEFRMNLNEFDWDSTAIENIRDKALKNSKSLTVIDVDTLNQKNISLTKALTKIEKATQALENAALNKKFAKELAAIEGTSPNKRTKMNALRAVAVVGTALVVADIYGNILRYNSDNPEPEVWPLQLGAEVLAKGAQDITEAIVKFAESAPRLVSKEDRGTVEELDPKTEKNH